MKRTARLFPTLVLGLSMILPGAAFAYDSEFGSPRVASHLSQLQVTAAEARRAADELESLTRNRVTWQSHANYLSTLRDSVNRMGGTLSKLEALKPDASNLQVKAIEHARPHLETLATNVEGAILNLNSDKNTIHQPGYQENLREIAARASTLVDTVDAIRDYEQASLRLGDLEVDLRN